jgi:hypothetical protein
VEERLVERGVEVDHVTVYWWVQRFTPLLADAARFARHWPGDRCYTDETFVKVNGVCRYVYPAVDQYGRVIGLLRSAHRDVAAARRFFRRAIATLTMTIRSVHSRRTLPTRRSAYAFARGAFGGVLVTLMPAPMNTTSKAAVDSVSRSRGRSRGPAAR